MCLLYCASDFNVIFKTFSITWQQISCQDLHQNVFPRWLAVHVVYVVNISNESEHKGTYGDVSKRSYKLMFKFDVYFRNIEVINYF